ncbi:class I SAM-dependent methyltransferase [Mesorhizobium sp. 113-3-3]|uniref:class I SAM-dependent methyltransferase n=1 Tax=Mesorhizobium sp. 113-3-3 TaxID=2744516 RepID=UPI001FD183C3|nr:methyltransferase domain-containing protein [Mesorhizobium sp. 113-3-3]
MTWPKMRSFPPASTGADVDTLTPGGLRRGDVLTERSFEASAYSDYRSSHQTPGYGADYTKTYRSGYYAALWLRIERSLVENILRPLGGPGRSCLDFACRTGRVTTVAGPLFGEVVGVDVSQSMLACARVPGNVQLVEADLRLPPFPEDSTWSQLFGSS